MLSHIARCLVPSAFAVCMVAGAHAQDVFPAWVGLYEPADLGWLENENRLGELCTDSSTLEECYARHLTPRVSLHELHILPDDSSDRIGDLIVVVTPGRGLSAQFRPEGSTETTPFTPDLFLQDWGYGPYFHQTVSDQHADWVQLPSDPWETPVWLRREADTSLPILAIQTGDIIELGAGGWYVEAVEPDALLLRAEQAGDLWCEEGEPPAIVQTEPTRFPRAQLTDSRGHLLFRLKYLKGC